MKRGFTLVEMLVVIGILAILIGAGMTTFSSSTEKAQKTKGQELVLNVATALTALYQNEGSWPRRFVSAGSDAELTAELAYDLATRKLMTLTYNENSSETKTIGLDRFGILTPWAAAVVKKAGNSASESTRVPSGGTVRDHRVHFAIDDDGDGYVNASVGGESLRIRATAAVWSCGPDGEIEAYSKGIRRNGIYSWSNAQIKK